METDNDDQGIIEPLDFDVADSPDERAGDQAHEAPQVRCFSYKDLCTSVILQSSLV